MLSKDNTCFLLLWLWAHTRLPVCQWPLFISVFNIYTSSSEAKQETKNHYLVSRIQSQVLNEWIKEKQFHPHQSATNTYQAGCQHIKIWHHKIGTVNALLLIEQTSKEKPWWMWIQWSYEFKINTVKCKISYLYVSLLLTEYLCLSVRRSLENTFWLQQGSIWNAVLILNTIMEKQACSLSSDYATGVQVRSVMETCF